MGSQNVMKENKKDFDGSHMDIVIFGASGGAMKVAQTFDNLQIPYQFLVDNDRKKWGTLVCGKEVKAPETLLEKEYRIVIASDYQSEIEEQLEEMKVSYRLTQKEELILEELKRRTKEYHQLKRGYREGNERKIYFELIDAGICLGGIETWTLMVVRALRAKKENVKLLSRDIHFEVPGDIADITKLYEISYAQYAESIMDIAEELVGNLPCTVVTSWQSQVMMAAIMVKDMFPGKIKIVSVLHNDKITLYRRQQFLEPYTDKIMGVSRKINKTLVEQFHVPAEKIFYKESPVEFTAECGKAYTLKAEQPLRIGFAARISKYQKRVDLLIKLIELLDLNGTSYHIVIAGDGSYYGKLTEWHENYHSPDKVEVLGRVPRESMKHFWEDKDIFLSVSDFEGASISMLEAMAQGAVPVVTNVSGVEEFVTDGFNGACSDVKDMESIAEKIKEIDNNRSVLEVYGKRSREIVEKKCRLEDYCAALLKEIRE